MMKSDKWLLDRLGYHDQIKLNIGDTTIGRNKNAHIITPSEICSRQHCIITLNPDDTVHIVNQSKLNGTYVNDEKIDERCELKPNDVIGVGCNELSFNGPNKDLPVKKEEMFLYRLININQNNFIEISDDDDDDDDEDKKNIKPVISNGYEKTHDEEKKPDVKPVVKNSDPQQNDASTSSAVPNIPTSPAPYDENQDDNELIYSQQMLLEIKKEVNFSEEVITLDDDFTIYISDDSCDAESNSWAGKLSQDQDFVINKVIASEKSNKRKSTKQIEAIPLVPAKRTRRNSVSSNVAGPSKDANKTPNVQTSSKQPPKSKNVQNCNGVAITSTSSASIPSTVKNTQIKDVNRLDPFSKPLVKTEKPKTFEDALALSAIEPKKVRIAHKPKPATINATTPRATNQPLVSILCTPKKEKTKKLKCRVRFAEIDDIREYEPNDDENGEIIIALPTKPMNAIAAHVEQSNSFENDPLHEIITDITEWKPDWLLQRNVTPPITDVNLVVCPLLEKYVSFDSYKNTVTPLLKHELWSSIQAENRVRNSFEVKIISMNAVKRASRRRFVFHLQVAVESNSSRANVGDFVTIKGDDNLSFFAYITNQRFTRSGYTKTTYLTMEASENVVKSKNMETQSLYMTPIANIRAELKLFNAVFYLDRTQLKSLILDPVNYIEPVIPDRISKFRYTGYDKLNDEQLEILKSIYNKSVNSSTSLSLIEGPPGTGKTRLIISIILQMLFGQEMKQKLRILVLASSNAAVDIIAKRLLYIRDKMESDAKKNMMSIVRFGVLNSMDPDVRQISPQNLKANQPLSPSAQTDAMKQMMMEQISVQKQIDDLQRKESAKSTVVQDRIKVLEKRLMQIKETIDRNKVNVTSDFDGTYQVMANARIICSTLSSAINLKQYIRYFDVCIIDEASQCTEPWSLVALQYQIKNLILVGDTNQLSPVVLSSVCRDMNFEQSLFKRLFDTIPKNSPENGRNKYEMTVQYRMHPDICTFSNAYFYNNRLTSAPHTVHACRDFPLHPYRVFHLNCSQSNTDMTGFCNIDEAKFICTMLKVMTKHAKPENYSYGIITPYAKQRIEIQNCLSNSSELSKHKIPVNTIDSYQGQEKDIIILCTTRTVGIGFLANPQRLNVALTRAKKCLVICGNFTSISKVPVWSVLLSDAKRRKKYFEIPKIYDFSTIADLLVIRRQQNPKPKTTSSTIRQ